MKISILILILAIIGFVCYAGIKASIECRSKHCQNNKYPMLVENQCLCVEVPE